MNKKKLALDAMIQGWQPTSGMSSTQNSWARKSLDDDEDDHDFNGKDD